MALNSPIESKHEVDESGPQANHVSDSKDSIKNISRKSFSRNWQGEWRKTPGRVLALSLIRLYQLTLSGFIGNACRHSPTCSEYGYEAIARHGLFRGGLYTIKRIAKCGPWGTSGFDPVPQCSNKHKD